jgi:hypothetical protein
VTNRDGVVSLRFVERDHFRLWQYMMANKHGLTIAGPTPCLWMPETEFTPKAGLFALAGPCDAVTRLTFAVYDQPTGLCNTTQRFVPTEETDVVVELLMQRIPIDVRASDDFMMEQQRGFAVAKTTDDIARIGIPLAS